MSLIGYGAPKTERRTPPPAVSSQDQPAQESWDVSIVISDSGRQKTLIKAAYVAEYRKGEAKEIQADGGVSVKIVNADSSATIITANRSLVHGNQDIEAFGNVVIRSGDGTVIHTEHITHSAHDRMIRSDKFVTITSPSRTIRGYGFESDDAMKHYRIFHASGEALSQ